MVGLILFVMVGSSVTETETILSQPFAKTNVSCPVGLAPL